ncbi:ester cyclase [Kibdelosporangium phytohabitans]|uniref:Ester cyclase n=1 Tax=Kibdelosporangium phytohabitans TaxID=860235 RepID=A0A0N9HU59_9PSEU|nr:ester cyclase [Kibdelosporangium phytohabitans]ALG08524.1 hypothetical protein AOZ06_17810 [Kibdelosporangium phytohabitans]MBE1470405.1 putative ester cyclase [Kibdelosporangium phytohabitans]
MVDEQLRARREKLVLDHFADEVKQDFDSALSTFPHPRYELIPTGVVHDGEAAVRGYYHATRTAFPDQRHEMIKLRHADDAVICEFHLLGTQRGPYGAIPPTGRPFKVRMTAFFLFEGDELVCERIYYDSLSILKQLLAGVTWKRPSSLLLLPKVLRGARKELG